MRKARGQAVPIPNEVFPIVAIGSSAGGLEAQDGLFRAMPIDSGTSFILVSHSIRGNP